MPVGQRRCINLVMLVVLKGYIIICQTLIGRAVEL